MRFFRTYEPLLFVLLLLTYTVQISFFPLQDWDESRHAANIYEMISRSDPFEYYYGNMPDNWSAKAPLFFYLQYIVQSLTGPGFLGLRLTTWIIGCLFLIRFRNRISKEFNPETAFSALCILLSSRGFSGHHMALTGDTDILLLFFLMEIVYAWNDLNSKTDTRAWLRLCLFTGLAFYTKSVAAFILYLGLFLRDYPKRHVWFDRPLRNTAAGITLFLLFPILWIVQMIFLSKPLLDNTMGSSRLELAFSYDITQRFMGEHVLPPFSLFSAADLNFTPWVYVLGILLILHPIVTRSFDGFRQTWVILFPVLPFIGFLEFTDRGVPWYAGPVWPFASIALSHLIMTLPIKFRSVFFLSFPLAAVIYTTQYVRMLNSTEYISLPEHKTKSVFYGLPYSQELYIRMLWNSDVQEYKMPSDTFRAEKNSLIFYGKEISTEKYSECRQIYQKGDDRLILCK